MEVSDNLLSDVIDAIKGDVKALQRLQETKERAARERVSEPDESCTVTKLENENEQQ